MMSNIMNIDTFCTCSGVSFSDKVALKKLYGTSVEKKYTEWYVLIAKNFTVPKNLTSMFSKAEKASESKKVFKKPETKTEKTATSEKKGTVKTSKSSEKDDK